MDSFLCYRQNKTATEVTVFVSIAGKGFVLSISCGANTAQSPSLARILRLDALLTLDLDSLAFGDTVPQNDNQSFFVTNPTSYARRS